MIFSSGLNIQIASSEPENQKAMLWHGWHSHLVCIKLGADGLSADFIQSDLLQDNGDPMPITDFLSMTMLEDGSLIYVTLESNPHPFISKIFHIQDPKSDGSTSYAKYIGTMPEGIGIEALYTDSQNRVYLMDTGVHHHSRQGNRLLRFTGDVTTGDFSYEVIESFLVPDIDGMGPGIDKTTGWVVDNPGYALDSYSLHHVDYETGDFTYINTIVGPYGIHAINGSFFSDGRSRLYVNSGMSLFEIDPITGGTPNFLGKGPAGIALTGSLAEGPPDEPDEPEENEPPVADAGEDQEVYEGEEVIFDGSNSRGSGKLIWDPHLVGLYHMNEGSGDVLVDSTPYENHGTLIGPSWTSDAKWGNALSFDGVDDYVDVKPNDEIFGDNPDGWSYMVWFRTSNDHENLCLISDTTQDKSSAISLTILHFNRTIGINVISTLYHIGHGYKARSSIRHKDNFTNDNWYFIVVTVSKIEKEHKLFINGENMSQGVIPLNYKDYFEGIDLRIGARNPLYFSDMMHPYVTPFDGILDEIVLFNRTLSEEEIFNYYHSGKEYYSNYSSVVSKIISYEWDFESDGIYDYQETSSYAPDGSFDGKTTHTYGDNGEFTVTLRVTDENGMQDNDTCNITVLNMDPVVFIEGVTMEVEIGLRVAGRKYNDVGMTLSENEKILGYVSIERMPGSPDDQMAWIPVTLNLSRTYSAVVTFTPEDPPNVGANPTWVYIRFPNGSIQKIHHTFNVQQSKKRDSEHWNHIEPWEVDINSNLTGWEFEVDYHVTDPGSDDETLTFTYGSQNEITTHLNAPPNPDPYPSPEVNPRDILRTKNLIYEGPGTLTVKVEDDDGGENQHTVDLV
jgi:hypothetical protein